MRVGEVEDTPLASGPAVRTIISALAGKIPLETLPGRKVCVVCNLKQSKMRGILSEGMLLAAAGPMPSPSSNDGSADPQQEQEQKQGESVVVDKELVELVAPPAGAPVGELIRISGFEEPVPDPVLKSKSAQEVWKRVASGLGTNAHCQVGYGSDGSMLLTSVGPCVVPTLARAVVR